MVLHFELMFIASLLDNRLGCQCTFLTNTLAYLSKGKRSYSIGPVGKKSFLNFFVANVTKLFSLTLTFLTNKLQRLSLARFSTFYLIIDNRTKHAPEKISLLIDIDEFTGPGKIT
jgi:hypothetical protein